jgi:hypothetical protein
MVIDKNKNTIMKRFIFLFIVYSVLAVLTSAYAQPKLNASLYAGVSDDSLMFDGHFGNSITSADDCPVKVKYVSGATQGSKRVLLTVTTCGVTSSSEQIQSGPMQKDDKLLPGSEISTGSDGKAELELGDGSVIRMGPNTTIKITQEHCVSTSIFTKAGNIWLKVKQILGGGKFGVESGVAGGGVRGTEFTFEVTGNSAVFTVYEGSVEVTGKKINYGNIKDGAKEMENLTKDFQNGKISMEEYQKKMEEYSNKMQETAKSTVMVEAGNTATVTDVIKGPEPFEKKSSNWFDDSNFK